MSARSSSSGGPYRKPRFDIYSWMLILSLVAALIACLCLYLEVKDYGAEPYRLSLAAPALVDQPEVPGTVADMLGAGLLTRPKQPTAGLLALDGRGTRETFG